MIRQPPLCVGKSLQIPEVVPVVISRQSNVESVYSIKNLNHMAALKKERANYLAVPKLV